jgi:hypothetical protein
MIKLKRVCKSSPTHASGIFALSLGHQLGVLWVRMSLAAGRWKRSKKVGGFPDIVARARLSKDGSHKGAWNKDESVPLSVDVDEYFKFRI